MSYILEALKKAERERKKDSVPDLQAYHEPLPPLATRRFRAKGTKRYIIGGAAALCIGVAILFMSKQDNKKSTVEVELVETSRAVEQVNSETLSREQPSPGPATEQTTTPPGRTISSPPRVTVEPHPIVLQEQTVIPPPPPRYPDPEKLPTLEELKNGLGRDLPELKLAGHTYSEVPDQRMIIINNRIIREGQRVEGGIRLEEITWDGLILSYQGARFTMDASR